MSRQVTTDIDINVSEHPAVKAWRKLTPKSADPEGIEILKDRKDRPVLRLTGIGPAGSDIIAKRNQEATAVIECTIYEEVLPNLPFRTIQYYGTVVEPEKKYRWLFLEDARGEEYSPHLPQHCAMAACWLGLMHTSASHLDAASQLPDRGPWYYLQCLRSTRDTIVGNFTNPALRPDDLTVLKQVLLQCEFLELRWRALDSFCEGAPRTLVHGDFVRKNMRVRQNGTEILFLPFDWGTGGWAVPAADLAVNLDISIYWSVVRDYWPCLDLHVIQQLSHVGTIFRVLASMSWAAERLSFEWVEKPMRHMRHYEFSLAEAIQKYQQEI